MSAADALLTELKNTVLAPLRDGATQLVVLGAMEGMRALWLLDADYRESFKNFNCTCVIRSKVAAEHVAAAAVFHNNAMTVKIGDAEHFDVRVTFRNAAALLAFMETGGADILTAALNNDAQIEGNYNYFYRVAFLVRELLRRTGLEQLFPSWPDAGCAARDAAIV